MAPFLLPVFQQKKGSLMKVPPVIRAIWQLLCYVIIGLPVLIILLPSAPWVIKSSKVKTVWIWFDRLVCTIAHGTWKRTISGWTGQHMKNKPRYKHQAKIIDWCAELVGDEPIHSMRAYIWEKSKGLVNC
ncbi:MAG: hypothetical protein ACI88H_002811 [Cocleimonas sp.]|jgi:hypothetical protein